MIIALQPKHRAAEQLAALCVEIRKGRRGELPADLTFISNAINLTETSHGHYAASYVLLPGNADNEGGVAAYRYLKNKYPEVLDMLCMAAENDAKELTIEVGTLSRRDCIQYSSHNLMHIMPRVIAGFRGHHSKV